MGVSRATVPLKTRGQPAHRPAAAFSDRHRLPTRCITSQLDRRTHNPALNLTAPILLTARGASLLDSASGETPW
jgi:hypothetical protein